MTVVGSAGSAAGARIEASDERALVRTELYHFWDELVACEGELSRILELIALRAADVLGEASALTVVSEDGTTLEPVATFHPDPAVLAAMRDVLEQEPYRIGSGIAGRAAQRREAIVLADLSPDEALGVVAPAWRDFVSDHPFTSIMVVPLVAYGELVGTLGVFRLGSRAAYSVSELHVLEALAERAALAIADVRRSTPPLSRSDLKAIFEHSLDGVLFTKPDGTILAANPAACDILGLSEQQIIERGRAGLLPSDDPDVAAALSQRAAAGRARAELPMIRGDGSQFSARMSSSIFTTEEGEVRAFVAFRDISEQVAARAQLEAQRERLERLAELDDLTGLLNRRGLAASARRTFAFADRDLALVQVVYFDIDGLKAINDRHGHRTGDRVIAAVGAALRQCARAVDVAARVGGDEFVLVLYAATADDVLLVLERVRGTIAKSVPTLPVAFSAGCSERGPGDATSLDELLEAADKEMYAQKDLRRARD